MTTVILAALGASFLIALIGTALARILSVRLGFMDTPGTAGHLKASTGRVPNTGGIAIFAAIALPLLFAIVVARLPDHTGIAKMFPAVVPHLEGIRSVTTLAIALLGAMGVLHVMGLIDDRRALKAGPKLLVMCIVCAVFAAIFNELRLLRIVDTWTGVPGGSYILTVLWFVVVTNAMNFMDNMDGLCAGVASVCALCFMIGAWMNEQWFIATALALLLGACLGFLVFNIPFPGARRASIYMGDCGSLVIGFLLAFLTVKTTYIPESATGDAGAHVGGGLEGAGGWYAALMPIVVLAVPLYDFASVTLIRVLQGKSPFKGDQQHFSHRLRARGLTPFQVLCVLCACAAITGVGGLMLRSLHDWAAALVGVQTLLVLGVIAALEYLVPGQRDEPL
ncbi:MAG: undecaprenyl/decaprenyl-phosphate alpha-N-acetylglucosaminyl 1-phosphate transferase [Phycisphaeraceae bacterium]|nr:undecaprenyl/decaprenyl-phosphate alpha-N-acetylglucosaminyl 1-phosphate transferase [Phycisphaerales bacterium]MCB9842429.1 undecaprenyl/decaprenyl-phosphate alpha-N-acetylglucosaminyl 1-phosphate transferase [Phycisphaeraceae bacterium]